MAHSAMPQVPSALDGSSIILINAQGGLCHKMPMRRVPAGIHHVKGHPRVEQLSL